MKSALICFLSIASSGAAGAGAALIVAPRAPVSHGEGDAATELAVLWAEVERIGERQAELADALEARLPALAGATRPAARVSLADVEAVRRYFAEREGSAQPVPAGQELPEPAAAEEFLARLFDGDLEGLAREELWQEVREAGRMDEVLALMEARAATDPNDPEMQLDLGVAYLEKIQEVGNGPLAGALATKADAAFDRALAIDEQHWQARFHKAVALSFWPPLFGKQNEAIHQFELLVAQQGTATPAAHHARTHLLLGNMHQQIGNTEEALAAWRLGLELYPGDPDLMAQLQLVGD